MSIPSRNVSYIKPQVPAFLKAFKDKVGYVEPAGIEAKRPVVPEPGSSDDHRDEIERDDELPTVVALKEGDLKQEDFLALRRKMKEDSTATGSESSEIPTVAERPIQVGATKGDSDSDGRIKFIKPRKRKSSESKSGVLDASTSKKSKGEGEETGVTRRRRRSSGGESKSGRVKNNSLLSFGQDDDEET